RHRPGPRACPERRPKAKAEGPTLGPTPSLPAGQVWRFYYCVGAQRVALRVQGDAVPGNNGVFYLLGDHPSASSGQAWARRASWRIPPAAG
ncbi:MAG TPA: hypothetical protein VJK02_08455, partial [Anaerolineales bacterium]|nr:hypothetical protein [Anaerolineales bacterium]